MAPQVERSWTRLCESKRPHPKAHPSCGIEGAEFPRNPDTLQLEVDGHCTHLAAATEVATLERSGETTQFERQALPQNQVAEVAVAAVHCHLLQNHLGFHAYLPPSEIYEFKHQQYNP